VADDGASAEFYDDYYRGDDRITPDAGRFWKVAERERDLLDPGSMVVDIGCGDGHLCAELSRRGWGTVVGLDVSRSRVARARKRYPFLRLSDRPIRSAQIPSDSVDLVVMDNVIEHLPDPLATVSELRPYLAARGRLVIVTPNMESGHYRLLGRRWTPELAPHAHIYLFTTASLDLLVSAAGFQVIAVGSFHEPRLPASALFKRAARGDVRGALWRAIQEAGATYGRLIGAGPMLYVVAVRRADEAGVDSERPGWAAVR
jgi:SAM-dependent methyltransferase